MTKLLLNLSMVVVGVLLAVLHYKLKPKLDEKQIGEYAQTMSSSMAWQGQIAPDFELKTTRGVRFKISDNIGRKIIVLNFFATWCGPCRDEMPELNRYFNQHKAQDFSLIAIDAEEKQDRVDQFLEDLKLDFPAGIDDGAIQKQYGVSGLPTTVLIGVDGKVQFYESGALANAEVAFDNLLKLNHQLLDAGRVISQDEYRHLAQKQPKLLQNQTAQKPVEDDENKLDARGKRIVARMDCPCGCDKKVQACTCNTSKNIQKALAHEDFNDQSDSEIVKSLNKRFCGEGM